MITRPCLGDAGRDPHDHATVAGCADVVEMGLDIRPGEARVLYVLRVLGQQQTLKNRVGAPVERRRLYHSFRRSKTGTAYCL